MTPEDLATNIDALQDMTNATLMASTCSTEQPFHTSTPAFDCRLARRIRSASRGGVH